MVPGYLALSKTPCQLLPAVLTFPARTALLVAHAVEPRHDDVHGLIDGELPVAELPTVRWEVERDEAVEPVRGE